MSKPLPDLFIIANVNAEGNVVEYPQGGGSSAKATIRAFDTPGSAVRSLQGMQRNGKAGMDARVMRVTSVEEAF